MAWACRDAFKEFNECLKERCAAHLGPPGPATQPHVPDVRAYVRGRTTDEELNRRLDEYYASGVEAPKYAQGPVAPR